MIKAPKSLPVTTLAASDAARAPLPPRPAGEVSLGLEPAELDALVERLCLCSTLRIESGGYKVPRRRRCRPASKFWWCRLGHRATAARGVVETKFG
jgi:hypothetical protein